MEDIKFRGIVYMLRVYSIMKYKKAIENPLWKKKPCQFTFCCTIFSVLKPNFVIRLFLSVPQSNR